MIGARSLFAIAALASAPVRAAAPDPTQAPLALRIGSCLEASRVAIEQVVSLELNRPVTSQASDAPSSIVTGVTVSCRPGVLALAYAAGQARRTRLLDVRQVPDKALARTVALAIVALLEAPDGHPGRAAPLEPQAAGMEARHAQSSPATQAGGVALLGAVRFFPAASDLTLGARLRSKLIGRGRNGLFLGVGAERGRAERDAGFVRMTAVSGELSAGHDWLREGPFVLATELLAQGGYVALRGEPKLPELTAGQSLTGAWLGVGVGLAPRWHLAGAVELGLQVGGGFVLLGPRASSDQVDLEVWRGMSLTGSLGLLLAL